MKYTLLGASLCQISQVKKDFFKKIVLPWLLKWVNDQTTSTSSMYGTEIFVAFFFVRNMAS